MFHIPNIIAVFLACICLGLLYVRRVHQKRFSSLFPGPKSIPLLGNAHQFPLEYQHRVLGEWNKIYGDIIYTRLFRRPVLILNSAQAAFDLLEKRGSKYSDRPRFVLINELIGFDPNLSFMPYGDQWRRHRKWFQAALIDKRKLETYHPMQLREVHRLLYMFMQTPDGFIMHIKRLVGALSMEISYGHRATSLEHDEHIKVADDTVTAAFEAGNLGSSLLDFFPILKYLPAAMPGMKAKREALRIRPHMRALFEKPYFEVKKAMALGTAKPCFLTSMLEDTMKDGDLTEEDEYNIMGAAGVLYAAATDTTSTTLSTFVLAMVLHPDIYRKAQAEIDRVIGTERLPDFNDRSSLPYLENVLQETYRWNIPVPLGVPHAVIGDDEYQGHYIPGGTTIIPNIWLMARDPDVFPDPDSFRPERFEEMDTSTAASRDMQKIVFGFGRRVCPGRQFADTTVWLAMANIIAAFDISKAKDAMGNEITPVPAFSSGTISHPKPFKARILPRSDKAAAMVSQLYRSSAL
ncbi:cytochrome P450 [Laetiporus sulphureus 93-53]|uniref:Cytochrome P450 n=1 Tax=Laetiporus sulphureus 93-53 TaxID=1314785 RepID=A0A165CQ10_9APHY|nr:cytochrome P450 [Laetiporus sulphureus 93-53]KZT03210.1 cytochrome P450 [Laetiporus sulphureus 93-53]